ncbi:MAG: hypothetical protein ABW148_06485 [Sedimenticola sp.]
MVNSREKNNNKEPYVALLITGTCRELLFLLELMPRLAGETRYDIFLVLRQVYQGESSRMGGIEKNCDLRRLNDAVARCESRISGEVIFCRLPAIDPEETLRRVLIPVGPTTPEREMGMVSMFHGVFTGVEMILASQRPYTHVLKTRTDYLPAAAPWIDDLLMRYEAAEGRIIVDGCATVAHRYPDRPDIPWQGSIHDVFSFSSFDQFLQLWDFRRHFDKVWTGIPETTLFRSVMLQLLGDDLQSPRRNQTLLDRYFVWDENSSKQSKHLMRAGLLSDELKRELLTMIEQAVLSAEETNRLLRKLLDYIAGALDEEMWEHLCDELLGVEKEALTAMALEARGKAAPI